LILHESSLAQWVALVRDAGKAQSVKLTEELESYLVFLLMRFNNHANWLKNAIGLELLDAYQKVGTLQNTKLQCIGDQCILYAGFFQELTYKKALPISYYVKLGKIAFSFLAHKSSEPTVAKLYCALDQQFVTLIDVLQNIRLLNAADKRLTALEAEQLWQDTGSLLAKEQLQGFTQYGSLQHHSLQQRSKLMH